MTVSDLIIELQEMMSRYGDPEIKIMTLDGEFDIGLIESQAGELFIMSDEPEDNDPKSMGWVGDDGLP